jgi:protein TonB
MKSALLRLDGRWLTLFLIACLHMMGLAAAALHLRSNAQAITTPPVMTAVLVAAPSVQPTPAPPEPRPQPVQKQRPAPTPAPATRPPLPAAPPSERAISTPPPAESPTARSEPAPAPTAEAAPPAAPSNQPSNQPVTPPYASASHLNNPAPVYPSTSRRLGEQGRVVLDVYILADGTVGEIRVRHSCGHSRLDDAALDAVKRWRFVPARRGNEAIAYWYALPISFSLTS